MDILTENQRSQLLAMPDRADRSIDWPAASWNVLRTIVSFRMVDPERIWRRRAKPCRAALWDGRDCPLLSDGGVHVQPCTRGGHSSLVTRSRTLEATLLAQAGIRRMVRDGGIIATDDFAPASWGGTARKRLSSGDFELTGEIPWVTGADHAAGIVAGATLEDGSQLLVAIPAEELKEMIEPPLLLAALTGSRTSLIRCHHVVLKPDCVLAGPIDNVLGKSGGGGLDTSCLAIGLAGAATEFIRQQSQMRPDLSAIAEQFETALVNNRERMHSLAEHGSDPNLALDLRLECTKLVLRNAQASLMVAKGIGFVEPHPVQRWVRQATFFLVWSCPRPVAEGVLADLAKF